MPRAYHVTGNFDGGDVGDVDDHGGVLARDTAHPYGSGFQDVALDQGAGIDEVGGGHLAPLADDGFRQRLAFDGDRLIVRIVVVDVEGWVGQAGDEAAPIIFR